MHVLGLEIIINFASADYATQPYVLKYIISRIFDFVKIRRTRRKYTSYIIITYVYIVCYKFIDQQYSFMWRHVYVYIWDMLFSME